MARSSNTLNIKMGENDQLIVKQEKFLKPNGELCIRRYVQSRLLGKGGFGKVYQFNCLETNELYAAKIIPKASLKDEMHMQKFKAEIKLHKMLEHPNIVKFERNFEDEENYYILLELYPNDNLGQLLQRRGKLTEVEVQYYIFHIAEGLKHIHEQKILHRDLKVANILLNSKMEVKIADFGLAAKLSSDFEKRKTVCGTPNFIAPEILDNSKGYSYPADIWSLGVICFNLLTGKLPFEAFSSKEIYSKIQDGKYSFPANINLSIAAKDLVSKMLVVDPEQRIKLSKILRHPFLNPKGGIPSFMPTSTMTTIPPASLTKQTPVTEGPPKLSALFHKAETVKSARGDRPQSMDKAKGLKQPPLPTPTPTPTKEKVKEVTRERPKTPQTIRTPQKNKSDSSGENANAETKTSLNKENMVKPPAVREESKEKIGKVGKDPLAENKTIETNISKASLLKSRSNFSTKASSLNNLDKPAATGVQNPVVIQRNNFANLFNSQKRVVTTENTEPSTVESRAPLRMLTSPVKEKEQVPAQQPEVSVVKKPEESGELLRIASYLDETANYGLTYVFSNKSVGILFNDDTKILLDPTGREFYYVEVGVTNKEAYVKYSLENYPEELKTKVANLERANKHFYKYVTERSEEKYTGSLYYVRKWLKTKHATLFRLNTQELQVIFIDGSVMSLSPNGKDLKYVKKTGEFSRYDLEKDSLSKDQEVKKRLVYTMEVMEKIWNKK